MNHVNNSIIIDILDKDKLNNLAELFQLVHGGDYEKVYSKTKWAFDNDESIILVAKDRETGKLVGARGAIYWPLNYKNKVYNTYQFHGTCVHPDYRRQGIFTKLNKEFLVKAKKMNIHGIFNISVNASMEGYKKLGWSYLSGFERLMKVPKPLQFLNRIIKIIFKIKTPQIEDEAESNNIYIEDNLLERLLEIRNNTYKNRDLLYSFYDKETFKQRLSDEYADYKYLIVDDNLVIYKMKKIRKHFKGLLIGDILLNKYDKALFNKIIKKLTKKEQPDIILTYLSNKHPNYYYFKKTGFFSTLKKDMNFGTKAINYQNNYLFGNEVWQTSIFDIDTF